MHISTHAWSSSKCRISFVNGHPFCIISLYGAVASISDTSKTSHNMLHYITGCAAFPDEAKQDQIVQYSMFKQRKYILVVKTRGGREGVGGDRRQTREKYFYESIPVLKALNYNQTDIYCDSSCILRDTGKVTPKWRPQFQTSSFHPNA